MSEYYPESPKCCENIAENEKPCKREPESDQEIKRERYSFKAMKTLYNNYKSHLICYLTLSALLAKNSYFMLVHGFYPGAYATKVGEIVVDINKMLKENGCHVDWFISFYLIDSIKKLKWKTETNRTVGEGCCINQHNNQINRMQRYTYKFLKAIYLNY